MEQSKVQWSPPSRFHGSTPHWRDPSVDCSKLLSRPPSIYQKESSDVRKHATNCVFIINNSFLVTSVCACVFIVYIIVLPTNANYLYHFLCIILYSTNYYLSYVWLLSILNFSYFMKKVKSKHDKYVVLGGT